DLERGCGADLMVREIVASAVERAQSRGVVVGDAAELRDVVAGLQLTAIPSEELRYIAAESEEIHDVAEVRRVAQAERVPELVDAGEIHDGLAQQRIRPRPAGDVRSERRRIGPDVDGGPSSIANPQRPHLAVL